MRERFGTRLLLVSHDATEITAVCDEVAVLRAGRLVAQGEPARIFAGADTAAGAELGYENVLRGEVQTLATGSAILRLAGDTLLEVPRGDLQPGDEALFAVRADDVLLALERPRGISARNLLAAQVHSIVERGEEVLVVSDLPGQATRLCAELTPASVRELDLRPGREVVLLIKTRACRPLARLVADPAPSTP